MMKINWKKIWRKFDNWHNKNGGDWAAQTRKIEKLIEKELEDKK